MTIPAPTFATAARSAAEEDAEIAAWIATHSEDVSRLRIKLAEMPVNDTHRKHVRARLAEAVAAIEDAQEARAALRPRLESERAEAAYQRARDAHAGALHDVDSIISEQAASLARQTKHLVACIAVTAANIQRTAARAGLSPDAILPDAERLAGQVVAQLVLAGLLDAEHMPQRYLNDFRMIERGGRLVDQPLSPAAAVAADGPHVAVDELRRAVVANAPRSPEQAARAEAEAAARRAAEAVRLAQPLAPMGPSPAPWNHLVGR
ncbi:hypothetical protein [Siccirubricoccus phaeus]|uniref:hypothetical protein n=1 Tax=Siccirubricoccus phaeus TaxID=2595053 RepID=UPI0011F1691F|nr:hypothetical protein [Siccirubricoccus phaeus]